MFCSKPTFMFLVSTDRTNNIVYWTLSPGDPIIDGIPYKLYYPLYCPQVVAVVSPLNASLHQRPM